MPLLPPEPFLYPDDLLANVGESASRGAWLVLHTRPRSEKTLARRFLERGIPFFLPIAQREWRNRGRTFRSQLPLFPGYVFLRGDPAQRTAALETNLVANVIPVEDQHGLHADLLRVHRLITSGAPVTPEERLAPGDLVEIIKGPLAGLEGTVLRRGKQLRFVVEVQFLRRAISAEVEGWMLQPHSAMAPSACLSGR